MEKQITFEGDLSFVQELESAMAKSEDQVAEEKDCKPAKYCKPPLKGALDRKIKFNVLTAVGLGILGGFMYYTFVGAPRKKKYADFYRDYNAEEAYKTMKKKKLFQSG